MKLLLTSNGLSNPSIVKALIELVGKPAAETTLAFVPTAMNVERGDKGWFIDNLRDIQKQGFKDIDIVDISALSKDVWLPRLQVADVLFFSGGDCSHLIRWIKESGLVELLPKMIETKVWVGASAGSMVTNPTLALSNEDKQIYYEEMLDYKDEPALGFVDFYIRPHFNAPGFPDAQKEYLEDIAKETTKTIYALDDNSAVQVNGDRVEIVSEGDYLVLNK